MYYNFCFLKRRKSIMENPANNNHRVFVETNRKISIARNHIDKHYKRGNLILLKHFMWCKKCQGEMKKYADMLAGE